MDENNVTLGQRITAYRTRARLSQDALAELLAVSRQSVSKWETDASVPELGKLVRLAQVFGVTLDELVTGEAPQTAPDPADPGPAAPPAPGVPTAELLRAHRQKMAGIVLAAVTAVACLLVWELIFLLWPVLVLGVMCLVCRRVTVLDALWLAWLSFVATSYALTSVNLFSVFYPEAYGVLNVQLIVAWTLWAVLAVLTGVTVRRCRAGEDALPSWPMLALMAAACVPAFAWYLVRFGPRVFLAKIFLLPAGVLASLTLAKLKRKGLPR